LLGGNLAIELVKQGYRVVCIRRERSKIEHLRDFSIEWVLGDITNEDSLKKAFQGASAVFHCAAVVKQERKPSRETMDGNVGGTKNVVNAVRAAGVKRLIHCSSIVAVSISEGAPSTEDDEWNLPKYGLDDGYSVTKRLSEELVVAATKSETPIDAVVVNPGYMIGSYDAIPSSGELIISLIKGEIPGYPSGINSFVDVRDIVRGMINAWKFGRIGERYIMSGHNLTYEEFFQTIEKLYGKGQLSTTRSHIPYPLALSLGWIGEFKEYVTGRQENLNVSRVRWAYCPSCSFSTAKAEKELDYKISPLEPAIQEAITFFQAQKMV